MNKQLVKKITTFSFLALSVLTYLVINTLFQSLGGAFGAVQRLYSVPMISHGLPVLAAVLVFCVLQFNAKIVAWSEDVILEVSKVVWPSRKDTTAMTIVVCVFVGIASVLLIVIDYVAREFVQMIMSI